MVLQLSQNFDHCLLLSPVPQAYEEVQDFFSSSCPTGVLSDLIKALDAKCQAINKLSALLQDLTEGKLTINSTALAAEIMMLPDVLVVILKLCLPQSNA